MYSFTVYNNYSTLRLIIFGIFSWGYGFIKGTYAYLRRVRLFFWPDFFQGVRLFKEVRLFKTNSVNWEPIN